MDFPPSPVFGCLRGGGGGGGLGFGVKNFFFGVFDEVWSFKLTLIRHLMPWVLVIDELIYLVSIMHRQHQRR